MNIFVISLLFMLISNINISAEEENASLVDESDYVLECVELNAEAYLEDIEYIDALPSKVDLSETKFFPPVDLQVSGSCVAWATVYYQYTYEVARLNICFLGG